MQKVKSVGVTLLICAAAIAGWKPVEGPLATRWAKEVSPENVLPEYPRPQMKREQWLNLNGLWEYAIRPASDARPRDWDGEILVPFPVESALSGVMKTVGPENRLWYRRGFTVPEKWAGNRVILNFGAVDWDTSAWVNGKAAGSHKGGYDPFSFDITGHLQEGANEITISVWDPSNKGSQPTGKQVIEPHKIWYTPTTGIWQTVWLEPVAQGYIKSLKITPDLDSSSVTVRAVCSESASPLKISALVRDGSYTKAQSVGKVDETLTLKIDNPKTWSPDSPFLYDLEISLQDASGKQIDRILSYFGMRKVSLAWDASGFTRIMLNNKFIFQYGPLDQGFWPDGLYTAPTDEALKYDLDVTRELGFNMLRKHVKVEPDRLYYWADKLGLLVWQDMPSINEHAPIDSEAKQQFELELRRMIEAFGNHPSIVMWVVFNEGWGQHDTEHLTGVVRELDPTRPANSASGWFDLGTGQVSDIHQYPGPTAPVNEPHRAVVLGEFGGLGLPLKGHTWQDQKNWGYRGFEDAEELTEAYRSLVDKLRPYIAKGLSAAVYTQTSDVETEVNGLLTYDRAVVKPNAEKITKANRKLYEPLGIKTILPGAAAGSFWRYINTAPGEDWKGCQYDDSSWQVSQTCLAFDWTRPRADEHRWINEDIYLRRTFVLETVPDNPLILLYTQKVKYKLYLNGRAIEDPANADIGSLLRAGRNCLAVECTRRSSNRKSFFDAQIVSVAR